MTRMRLSLMWALALAACGTSNADVSPGNGGDDGEGSGSGAPANCTLSLMTTPIAPVAGAAATVSVIALTNNVPGAFTYAWSVSRAGVPVELSGSDASISFVASDPGVYDLSVTLIGAPAACAVATRALNVSNPDGRSETLRLRVLAPQRYAAPPLELFEQIQGGTPAQDLGVAVIPTGSPSTLHVIDLGGAGVPAYVQLSPAGAPDAIVEAFTDDSGAAPVILGGGLYNVLVVPSDDATAPRRIAGWTAGALGVTAGQTITGTVRDPAGAVLVGAQVQLAIDGVPSTVATTGAAGNFTLHAQPGAANASVTLDVTPPAPTGLPRLSATSTGFDLGAAIQVRYASNVATRDLAGLQIRRAGNGVAGAQVTVVGQVGAVGTVTAGAVASATGSVALAATALAGGALPAMRVPAAVLSAVIAVGPGDVAVAALDTSTAAPASLDAPAMQLIATAVTDAAGHGLGGAVLDLVPAGALAVASTPPVRAVADPGGAITARIAAGGHYDLRLRDPAGRGGPLVVADRTTATIATTLALGAPSAVRGQILYAGHEALVGAAVQLLCNDCTGIERTRPIAEAQTDAVGRFSLTVPDPGTVHHAAPR